MQNAHFYKQKGACLKAPSSWTGSVFQQQTRGCQILPQNPSPEKGQNGVCPFHRSHREICTRNRPVSETKFLDDFWRPLPLLAPFGLLLNVSLFFMFPGLRCFRRRRTNVQQPTCNIDLSCSFCHLFFSFAIIELKPFVLKGKVLGEIF